MSKRLAIGILVLALVAGVGYLAFGQGALGAGTSNAAEKTAQTTPVKASDGVVAEAKVVPVRSVSLSMPTGGTVAEVLVAEGNDVEPGQVIARLDNARQLVAVSQAEAGLARAQAHLDEVKAGPRAQEIDAAKAAVESAQAQLARTQQAARPEEIAAAEAQLAAAQAALAKAQKGPDNDLIVAAQGELAKLKAGPTAEDVKAAEIAIEQAKSNLWSAQTERDGICGNPMAAKYQCDAANARVSVAEQQISVAQNALAKVKAGPRAEDVATAQARLDRLMSEPSAETIANARAQVEQARAKLDVLKAPARAADVQAAEAEVRRAQAQLKLVESGARPEAIAAAEADVAAAKAALNQAKVALAETELRAPLAGALVSLNVKAGEVVAAGAPLAQVADTSGWQIETTDLTELSVVKVREGQPVKVTFDAIPGLELPGTVARVKSLGSSQRGDIVYTVVVQPAQQDERLRWNMTAAVNIAPR